MEKYIIDTNAVSDYFSSSLPEPGLKFMDDVIDSVPNISVITQIELRWWKTSSANEIKIKDFISDCYILDMSTDVIEYCVNLRKTIGIKIPDAIIAPTALVYDHTLITNDAKDFGRVKGLKLLNPHKI